MAAQREWEQSCVWSPNTQFVDRLFAFAGYPPTFPPLSIGDEDHSQIDRRWQSVITTLIDHERH
jgi:hypothetical protein